MNETDGNQPAGAEPSNRAGKRRHQGDEPHEEPASAAKRPRRIGPSAADDSTLARAVPDASGDEYGVEDLLTGLSTSQTEQAFAEIDQISATTLGVQASPSDNTRVESDDEYGVEDPFAGLSASQLEQALAEIDGASAALPGAPPSRPGEARAGGTDQSPGRDDDAVSIDDYPDADASGGEHELEETATQPNADRHVSHAAEWPMLAPHRNNQWKMEEMLKSWGDLYLIPGEPGENGKVDYYTREEYRKIYKNNKAIDLESKEIIYKSIDKDGSYLPKSLFHEKYKDRFNEVMDKYCLTNDPFNSLAKNGRIPGVDGRLTYQTFTRPTPGGPRPQKHEYSYPVQAGADNPDLLIRQRGEGGKFRFTAMWANKEGIETPQQAIKRFGKDNVWCKRFNNTFAPLYRYDDLVRSSPGAESTPLENAFRAYWTGTSRSVPPVTADRSDPIANANNMAGADAASTTPTTSERDAGRASPPESHALDSPNTDPTRTTSPSTTAREFSARECQGHGL